MSESKVLAKYAVSKARNKYELEDIVVVVHKGRETTFLAVKPHANLIDVPFGVGKVFDTPEHCVEHEKAILAKENDAAIAQLDALLEKGDPK